MSEAREWAERTRGTRPSLRLLATDSSREPSVFAHVTEIGSCEVTVATGETWHIIAIPHDLAAALGRFLVRTFSEPSELIHGRPHDRKQGEDHA